jgi:hypothetical protein
MHFEHHKCDVVFQPTASLLRQQDGEGIGSVRLGRALLIFRHLLTLRHSAHSGIPRQLPTAE